MKYRFSALPWKLLALLLVLLSLTFGFLGGYTTAWCLAGGYYVQDAVYQTSTSCYYLAQSEADTVFARFRTDPGYDRWNILLEDNSFRFVLLEEESGVVRAAMWRVWTWTPARASPKTNTSTGRTSPCPWGTRIRPLRASTSPTATSTAPSVEDPETEISYQVLCLLPAALTDTPNDPFAQGQRQFNLLHDLRIQGTGTAGRLRGGADGGGGLPAVPGRTAAGPGGRHPPVVRPNPPGRHGRGRVSGGDAALQPGV